MCAYQKKEKLRESLLGAPRPIAVAKYFPCCSYLASALVCWAMEAHKRRRQSGRSSHLYRAVAGAVCYIYGRRGQRGGREGGRGEAAEGAGGMNVKEGGTG
jgi:hypothetical protein